MNTNPDFSVDGFSSSGSETRLVFAIGWTSAQRIWPLGLLFGPKTIDLDLNCLFYDDKQALQDVVFFNQMQDKSESAFLSGDNETGCKNGDAEWLTIDLARISQDIHALVFSLNNFTGSPLLKEYGVYYRLFDEKTGTEIYRHDFRESNRKTASILGLLYRNGKDWRFRALNEFCYGTIYPEIISDVERLLSRFEKSGLSG